MTAEADPRETLAREIAVAAAVTQTDVSAVAIAAMVDDLLEFPLDAAVAAIRRARREVTRLTLHAIVERVESADGHPGADAAWAMCPRSEADTVVWTDQMAEAYRVAFPLLECGDRIGARMAFKDEYERLVAQARERREAPKWRVSLGTDKDRREAPIAQAVELGRLPAATAAKYLPAPENPAVAAALGVLALPAPTEADADLVKRRLEQVKALLRAA